jgi:hypothetical protein
VKDVGRCESPAGEDLAGDGGEPLSARLQERRGEKDRRAKGKGCGRERKEMTSLASFECTGVGE